MSMIFCAINLFKKRDLITSYTKESPATKKSQQQKARKPQEKTGK
jgi:hypothetical protein